MIIEHFFIPVQNFTLPFPKENIHNATFFTEKNIANFVWNTLTVLEKNPATLSQTTIILNGEKVNELSVHHFMQVKCFGESIRLLLNQIESDNFIFDIETVIDLQALCGKQEMLEWGSIRRHQIPKDLINLVKTGLSELQNINNPVEQALNTFAFISKTSPFYHANKRTATLLMNGVLLSAGLYPLFIPATKEKNFTYGLQTLCEKGRCEQLLQVFKESVEQIYPNCKPYLDQNDVEDIKAKTCHSKINNIRLGFK